MEALLKGGANPLAKNNVGYVALFRLNRTHRDLLKLLVKKLCTIVPVNSEKIASFYNCSIKAIDPIFEGFILSAL